MNKKILSKKSLNSLKVSNILSQSDLSIFINYSGSDFKESLFLKNFLSKYNLKFIHIKNKPLISSFKDTRYCNISSIFQGNSLIIYQDKLTGSGSNILLTKLLLEKDFTEFLFENKRILPVGFLSADLFLTPQMIKSLMKRPNDLNGLTTYSLLNKVIGDVPNNYLNRESINILQTIGFLEHSYKNKAK